MSKELKIDDVVEFIFLGTTYTGTVIECNYDTKEYKLLGKDGWKYPRMSFTQSKTSPGIILKRINKDLEK